MTTVLKPMQHTTDYKGLFVLPWNRLWLGSEKRPWKNDSAEWDKCNQGKKTEKHCNGLHAGEQSSKEGEKEQMTSAVFKVAMNEKKKKGVVKRVNWVLRVIVTLQMKPWDTACRPTESCAWPESNKTEGERVGNHLWATSSTIVLSKSSAPQNLHKPRTGMNSYHQCLYSNFSRGQLNKCHPSVFPEKWKKHTMTKWLLQKCTGVSGRWTHFASVSSPFSLQKKTTNTVTCKNSATWQKEATHNNRN